jgi:hypothetical protein
MTAFNLLRPQDIMAGIDPHDVILPETGKVPSVPHFVVATLRGGMFTTPTGWGSGVLHAPKVIVLKEDALQRSTDIAGDPNRG